MAIIPEFQQQRLASSAVGTPGVDPSAGKVAGQVAEFFGGQADKQFEIATKRDDALAAAEANRRSVEYDIALGELKQTTQSEFSNNPKQGEIEFQNRSLELFNTHLGSSENKKANRLFSIAGQASIGRERKAFSTFRLNQEAVIAKNDLTDANNLLALEANKIGKTQHDAAGLQATFDLIDRSTIGLEASKLVLAPDQVNEFEKLGPESIMRGNIEGAIDTNPEYALEVLENPNVIKIFDDFDEIVKLEDAALKKIDDFDKKAEKQLTKQQGKTHFNNTLKLTKDPESISETELTRQVDAGEISPTQGISELKTKLAPPDRKSVPSVRAEGKRLEALGDLTNVWIADNASQLSVSHIEQFENSLTTGVTSNPSYKAAIESIDAVVDEIAAGLRDPEDDILFTDAAEAVRIAVIKENKNPMTVAAEQIKLIKEKR
jgi:hypothetical protein